MAFGTRSKLPLLASRVLSASVPMVSTSGMDVLEGADEIVIIDNGAYHIRIASVPYPPSSSRSTSDVKIGVYPNFIARTRSSSNRKSYISTQILTDLDEYGGLVLRQPHQKGIISDWTAQKLIWDHVFASHFASARPASKRWLENKAVIITESYFGLDEVRQATDLMLFEQYGAQALWRCDAASLAAWTDLFDIDRKRCQQPAEGSQAEDAESSSAGPPPAKRSRQYRNNLIPSKSQVSFDSSAITTTKASSARFRRPESFLVLDLGYSACHAVPVVRGSVQYSHTKRLDVGGKILTNLLKETLSFRQLDMMDEFWLVDYIRRRTSFVASTSGALHARSKPEQVIANLRDMTQSSVTAPCDWTFDQLLTLCKFGHRRRGDSLTPPAPEVAIQWKLPDYSATSSTAAETAEKASGLTQDERKYGAIIGGPDPGSRPSAPIQEPLLDAERNYEAAFIAQTSPAVSSGSLSKGTNAPEVVRSVETQTEEDDPQFLTLSNERFAVPEVLFAPSMIGLAQNGISELAAEAIASLLRAQAGSASGPGDLTWANILLIGGLANMPGLKRRLQLELRSLAPYNIPSIHVQTGPAALQHQHADLTPIKGGIILASAPASTPEHDWLSRKWLSCTEWSQSSNPTALAKQRFGRS